MMRSLGKPAIRAVAMTALALTLASSQASAQDTGEDQAQETAWSTAVGNFATSLAAYGAWQANVIQGINTMAVTRTNNAAQRSLLEAKEVDAKISQNYDQLQGHGQASDMNQFSAGPTAFANNNLVAIASLFANATTASKDAYNGLAGFSYAGNAGDITSALTPYTPNTCTAGTPCAPSLHDQLDGSQSRISRLNNLASLINGSNGGTGEFAGQQSEGNDGLHPYADVDTFAYTASMDPYASGSIPNGNASPNPSADAPASPDAMTQAMPNLTFSQGYMDGYAQYLKYIIGLPPEVPSKDPTFRSSPQGQAALVGQRERLAYANTALAAFAHFYADHSSALDMTNGTMEVTQVFQAAGLSVPASVSGTTSQPASQASLDYAEYYLPAEDPDFATNLVSMHGTGSLAFIGTELLALNRLQYKTYEAEQGWWQTRAALLALKTRGTDFTTAQ